MTQRSIDKVATNNQTQELQEAVYSTAVESFIERHGWAKDADPAILFAQADLANDKPRQDRSRQEVALVHLVRTITAVENASGSGLINNKDDAELLTEALIYSSMDPYGAIKYLKVSDGNNLNRAVSPRELIAALEVREELFYSEEEGSVSIATIMIAADNLGVSLRGGEISDDDLNWISESINKFHFTAKRPYVKDDPEYGPVPAVHQEGATGTSPVGMRSTTPNPTNLEEAKEFGSEDPWHDQETDEHGDPIPEDEAYYDGGVF